MKNIPLYEVRKITDLKDMLDSSTRLYGEKAAFLIKVKGSDKYEAISFNQYKSDVEALGTALLDLGLHNKRIALIGENRYEWAVSYLATVNGTGIIVPLDRELPSHEINNLLTRSECSAIIFSNHIKEKIISAIDGISSIEYSINMDGIADVSETTNALSFNNLIEKGKALIASGDRRFIDAKIDSEIMNFLLFTSGTTDFSKAVMLSHKNICANLMAMCSMLYIDDKDIFLSVLPVHHTYECTCGFLCQVYRGSTIAFCEGLRHIPKNLKESHTTIMLGVPLIFEAMYKRIWDQAAKDPEKLKKLKTGIRISNFLKRFGIDITKKLFAQVHETFGGSLKLFISGAAVIDPLVAKGFRDLGINLVQGYGLTECAPIVGLNRDVDFNDSAAGLPLPGLDVNIDNPNSDGIGEIIVSGPSVMLGYYNNEEATSRVLKNGWFYTGDLGYIDVDGFIHITGRKKNVIITKNGKNIFPEEIETLLNRSPYVLESMVVGKKDTDGDAIVSAVIVPNMDNISSTLGENTNTESIHNLLQNHIREVNRSLVLYKHIKDFTIRETEFAKTTTKKVKRYLEQ